MPTNNAAVIAENTMAATTLSDRLALPPPSPEGRGGQGERSRRRGGQGEKTSTERGTGGEALASYQIFELPQCDRRIARHVLSQPAEVAGSVDHENAVVGRLDERHDVAIDADVSLI